MTTSCSRRSGDGGARKQHRERTAHYALRFAALLIPPFTLRSPNFLTTCSHCNDKTNWTKTIALIFNQVKIKEKERKNPCGIHGRAHRPGHPDPLRRRQRARGKAHGLRRRLGAGGKLHRTRHPWAGIGT